MKLKNKIAIVTGGSRGLGRSFALRLAEEGANIVIADINTQMDIVTQVNEQAGQEIEKFGVQRLIIKTDVSKRDEVQNLIDTVIRKFKKIDILVNNAGINMDAMLHKMTIEQWDKVIAVNLTGVFNCMQVACKVMREQEYGRIINISSASWQGNIGQANYSASKAGIIGLTKTAAKELARKNITVNAICPGFIDTEMTRLIPEKVREIMISKIPMGRVGNARDVANLVAFLASDEASYITGEIINVGGGFTL
ncbi:MAG: 3-oxoacyl-ACP reductase FabG [Actinobacteria bacterium]|nr:3-oxoacyl-ACP reductase FabG [Actinomycetota bacterium]